MTALRITCLLASPAVSYHGLHLDGILAHALVERDTAGAMLPQTPEYVPCELPLRCVWRSAASVPLWASTDLLPEAEAANDVIYLHRRALEPHMTAASMKTGKGRYKERRSPLPAIVTHRLVAYADGEAQEIVSLLQRVTSIGKKRIVAGVVREWIIEEIDEFSFTDGEGRALRPLPHLYIYGEERDDGSPVLGFSPPYWHIATRARCVPTGAQV